MRKVLSLLGQLSDDDFECMTFAGKHSSVVKGKTIIVILEELDAKILDSVYLAGARFDRMLKKLMGSA